MQDKQFKEFIKTFNKLSLSQSISKTPKKFLYDHGCEQYYFLIDDDYFRNIKNDLLIEEIRNCVINFESIENRLKWLNKS